MRKFINLNIFINVIIFTFSLLSFVFFAIAFLNVKFNISYELIADIAANWKLSPMTNLYTSRNTCTPTFTQFVSDGFAGLKLGCVCGNTVSKGYCDSSSLSRGCKNLDIPAQPYTKWDNTIICSEKEDDTYLDYDIYQGGCPKDYKRCGVIDSLGNLMCKKKNVSCPLNYLNFTHPLSISDDMSIKTGLRTVYFSNENANYGSILIETRVSQKTPCLDSSYENYEVDSAYVLDKYIGKETCSKNPLEQAKEKDDDDNNNNDHHGTDSSYKLLDTQSYATLLTQNNIDISLCSGYLGINNVGVGLYIKPYVGLTSHCRLQILSFLTLKQLTKDEFYKRMTNYELIHEKVLEDNWAFYFSISQLIIFLFYLILNLTCRCNCLMQSFNCITMARLVFTLIELVNFIYLVMLGLVSATYDELEPLPFNAGCFGELDKMIITSLDTVNCTKGLFVSACIFPAFNILLMYWELQSFQKLQYLSEINDIWDICLDIHELEQIQVTNKTKDEEEKKTTLEAMREYIQSQQWFLPTEAADGVQAGNNVGNIEMNAQLGVNIVEIGDINRINENAENTNQISNPNAAESSINSNIYKLNLNEITSSEADLPVIYDYDNQLAPPGGSFINKPKDELSSSLRNDKSFATARINSVVPSKFFNTFVNRDCIKDTNSVKDLKNIENHLNMSQQPVKGLFVSIVDRMNSKNEKRVETEAIKNINNPNTSESTAQKHTTSNNESQPNQIQ